MAQASFPRTQLTYKELKQLKTQEHHNKGESTQLTYKELKQVFHSSISLWRSGTQLTYKELKQRLDRCSSNCLYTYPAYL